MPSFELNKSIEAKKLNKRSRLLLNEPPVLIPYGGLVEDIEEDGNNARFVYLGELYQCSHNLLSTALGNSDHPPARGVQAGQGSRAEEIYIHWQELRSEPHRTWRTKVPGGWLIAVGSGSGAGATFYPDSEHAWDGRTLD